MQGWAESPSLRQRLLTFSAFVATKFFGFCLACCLSIVGCTGGTGENEHFPLWFRCREGFLYRCGECDQIFMHVRVKYSLPDGKDPFPVDPEVNCFSAALLLSALFSLPGAKGGERWRDVSGGFLFLFCRYRTSSTSRPLTRRSAHGTLGSTCGGLSAKKPTPSSS